MPVQLTKQVWFKKSKIVLKKAHLKLKKVLLCYRLIRFGITGALATLTHLVIAFSILYFTNLSVWFANLIGFLCAFCLSYLMQTLFVFKKVLSFSNLSRFFTVQFSALICSQSLSELIGTANHYLQVILVVIAIPLITYIIHKIWTFKEQTDSRKTNEK